MPVDSSTRKRSYTKNEVLRILQSRYSSDSDDSEIGDSSDDESDSDRDSVRDSDDSTATLDYNPDDDFAC